MKFVSWFALPPSSPVSQRPSLRLRLTHGWPMVMVPTLTPMEATGPMDTDTLTLIMASTTARGPLMLSQRPMLMLMPTTESMVMDWDTTVWATEHTVRDTEATTMDKFSASEVQSRSSKRTSLL